MKIKSIILLGLAADILGAPQIGWAQKGKVPAEKKASSATAPSFKDQRKQTMASMKAIAVAWESYFNDFSTYCPKGQERRDLKWGNIKPEELQTILVPRYIKTLPVKDSWGNALQFAVQCLPKGGAAYAIRSAGSDKAWDGDAYKPGTKTLKPERDIVLSNGQFDQRPEGLFP